MTRRRRLTTATLTGAYLASIIGGVWAVNAIGVVSVGFGLMAPAAVYFVGLTLVLRDLLQTATNSKPYTLTLIAVGAALSALINPQLALASGVAFAASETVDFLTFTALERHGFLRASLASNAISIPVDSLIFLTLAFGSLTYLPGQIVGKIIATLIAVAVLWALRRCRRTQQPQTLHEAICADLGIRP